MHKLLTRLRDLGKTTVISGDISREIPVLSTLRNAELERLDRLMSDFLRRKTVDGAGGLDVNDRMRGLLALQACLPVLSLELDLYNGWHSVILYPDEFRAPFEFHDEAGVVHQGTRDLAGESWHRGPVVLAWSHVEQDALNPQPDGNVVIHEMAHKLDLLNGDVNGMPPLHRGMDPSDWSRAMSSAFEDLNRHLDNHMQPPIDPYAAVSPGEFFAVTSELFFVWPHCLLETYPEVYRQLSLYYRQDPGHR